MLTQMEMLIDDNRQQTTEAAAAASAAASAAAKESNDKIPASDNNPRKENSPRPDLKNFTRMDKFCGGETAWKEWSFDFKVMVTSINPSLERWLKECENNHDH